MRPLLALLLVLLLAGCSSASGNGTDQGSIGFQPGDGSVTVIEPEQRQPAPRIVGPALGDDGEIDTDDYAGAPLIINVWGSWCAPCRAEAPALVEADEQLDGVQLLGINTRDLDPAPAEAFVRAFGIEFPSIFDPDGALLLDFGQLPPAAIPSTIIIDEQGRVAARILGETSARTLVAIVEDLEAEE